MAVEYANLALSLAAWAVVLLFLGATLFWLFEIIIVGRDRRSPIEHPPWQVQVRILTINAEQVVQQTVNSVPNTVAGIHVIAEESITVDDAEVHVVPDDFTCDATRKGRAIEWARREVECTDEYILYLDEDTLVSEFHGLPDTDIVQLAERPIRSDGWVPYFAEMFRMGFQIEMRTFPRFSRPLYAWGGGIAVRKSLEDEITWDVNTVTEDTNFIWRAFEYGDDVDMQFLNLKLRNQAPPSVRELIHQRRRWISGAIHDRHLLPLHYRVLSIFRNTAWGCVFISPLLALPLVLPVSQAFFPELYRPLVIIQIGCLFGWGFIGAWYYCARIHILILLIITLPIIAIAHSAGAFWALFRPTTDFRVTEKINPDDVEDTEEIEEIEKRTDPIQDEELVEAEVERR